MSGTADIWDPNCGLQAAELEVSNLEWFIFQKIWSIGFWTKFSTLKDLMTSLKVKYLFFRRLLLILSKFWFPEEDQALGNNSMKFWDFLDISHFSEMVNLNLYLLNKIKIFTNAFLRFHIKTLSIICNDLKIGKAFLSNWYQNISCSGCSLKIKK